MNKSEFIAAIAAKADLKKSDAEAFYNSFVDVVVETLQSGDKIQLIGFGNFEVKERAAKEGINPSTREKIQIAACKAPSFKAGKAFKELIK